MKKMLLNITMSLAVVSLVKCRHASQPEKHTDAVKIITTRDTVKSDATDSGWTNINFKQNGIIEKMAYADTNNFLHQQIYPCAVCLLRPEVATALMKANSLAGKMNYRLVIFDCYRPKKFQQQMYDIVKDPKYVALPGKGSMHNKGCAVDISLADKDGKMLDMGSAFDDFTEKAHYSFQQIPAIAKKNRKMLKDIMMQAGFTPYVNEWWHFNFTGCNYETSDVVWKCQ